jgi:glycerophosphoryl diester phosphodiesterase
VSLQRATEWMAGFDPAARGGSLPRTIKDAGGAIWSPYFGDVTPELVAGEKGIALPQAFPVTP